MTAGTYSLADVIRAMDLRWGADRAIPISEIAERHNVPRRQVEAALEELVSSGSHPIVAGPRGVYLTDDPAELDRYGDSLLRARAMRQPSVLFPDLRKAG